MPRLSLVGVICFRRKTMTKPKVITPEQLEEIRTKDYFDCIAPATIKFYTDYYIVGGSFRCCRVIKEYPPSTEELAILSLFHFNANRKPRIICITLLINACPFLD